MSNVPFIPESQRLTLANEFFRLHATYARDIVIYQTATETVISTSPSENILFDNAPFNSETTTIINSGIFKARILYPKIEPLVPFGGVQSNLSADQSMIRLTDGTVRIRLDATGAALLSSCERVTFDNTIFDVETTQRPHALFGPPNFFDFNLKKIQ